MPVPHSYKSDPVFSCHIDRCHQLVIDRHSHCEGFYFHCQDPDLGQPRGDVSNWQNIKYVDFKVHDSPQESQLHLLQQFLSNSQPHKVLHVALYHDASSLFLRDLTWRADKMVLDLHDYYGDCSLQQRLKQHSQLPLAAYTYADYHWHDLLYVNLKRL